MNKQEIIKTVVREIRRNHWNYDEVSHIFSDIRKQTSLKRKHSKKLPYVLTASEQRKVMELLSKNHSFQINVFFNLALKTGMRISELTSLRKQVIDFESCRIRIVSGKGDKDRIIPFDTVLIKDLRKLSEDSGKSDYLFVNAKTGQVYSDRYWQMIVQEIRTELNICVQFTVHTFRHTFATNFYEKTHDLLALKDILGHENISTTQIYAHIAIGTVQQTYNQAMEAHS